MIEQISDQMYVSNLSYYPVYHEWVKHPILSCPSTPQDECGYHIDHCLFVAHFSIHIYTIAKISYMHFIHALRSVHSFWITPLSSSTQVMLFLLVMLSSRLLYFPLFIQFKPRPSAFRFFWLFFATEHYLTRTARSKEGFWHRTGFVSKASI